MPLNLFLLLNFNEGKYCIYVINANQTVHQKITLIRNTITHAVYGDIILQSMIQIWTEYSGIQGASN